MKRKKKKLPKTKEAPVTPRGIIGGYGGHPRQFTAEESDACFVNGRYDPHTAAMIYRGMMSEYDYD